jgi:hypothetical protein
LFGCGQIFAYETLKESHASKPLYPPRHAADFTIDIVTTRTRSAFARRPVPAKGCKNRVPARKSASAYNRLSAGLHPDFPGHLVIVSVEKPQVGARLKKRAGQRRRVFSGLFLERSYSAAPPPSEALGAEHTDNLRRIRQSPAGRKQILRAKTSVP